MMLLNESEGKTALKLAKYSVMRAVINNPVPFDGSFTPIFDEMRGAFVTLKIGGELRGCIGYAYPVLTLKEALISAATSAAIKDPRFTPVTPEEFESLEYEVTVLTPPEKLDCPLSERASRIEVGKHGLMVKQGNYSGLLLPQVAEEFGWNNFQFLMHTCLKAGLLKTAWMEENCEIYTFEGQIFSDDDEKN